MPKILIVDDEPNILLLTTTLFLDMGYDVVSAVNGEQAIELAHKERPDIILTDIIMPKKDGFEVCRSVRNTKDIAHTPIVMLSAMGDEYNKINGFEEGADDYITKPFDVEELKTRVQNILLRNSRKLSQEPTSIAPQHTIENEIHTDTPHETASEPKDIEKTTINAEPTPVLKNKSLKIHTTPTGASSLDECLYGGYPRGCNMLLIGPVGSGKSSFSRRFLLDGLKKQERALLITMDDNPVRLRDDLNANMKKTSIEEKEEMGLFRLVDAYSWCGLDPSSQEPFAVKGALELDLLANTIADASAELGQTVQLKAGGRRVIDSISSLFLHFSLPEIQRFVNKITRTSLIFGDVTTLFIVEEGTLDAMQLNSLKYVMDGIIEFDEDNNKRKARVASMKWSKFKKQWVNV
ncbi:MAG: response regulator [bacterium]|nr:response regulator [bacterium]